MSRRAIVAGPLSYLEIGAGGTGGTDWLVVGANGVEGASGTVSVRADNTGAGTNKTVVIGEQGATAVGNIVHFFGTTTGVGVTLGTVKIHGNLEVEGTENVLGDATFDANALFKGITTFGDANTDQVIFVADVNSNIRFDSNAASSRTLGIETTPVAGSAGTHIQIQAGDAGTTYAGAGSNVYLLTGGGAAVTSYGSLYFGNTSAVGQATGYQIFANNGMPGAFQPGIRYNDNSNAWEIQTDAVGWTTIASGSVLPAGALNQVLQHDGANWIAKNDFTLPSGAARKIDIASAATGNNLSVVAGAGTAGAGGVMYVTGGAGSTAGGDVAITGGAGTASTGGDIDINGGAGATTNGVITLGGATTSLVAIGGTSSTQYSFQNNTANRLRAGSDGNSIYMYGDESHAFRVAAATAGAGGALSVVSGAATGTGNGGALNLTAGAAGATSGNGGSVTLTAGGSATSGNGGNVALVPGVGATANGSIVIGNSAEASYSYALFNSTGGYSQAAGPGFRLNVAGTYMEAWNPTSAAWERITTGTGSIPSGTDQYQHLEWTGSAWAATESITLPENTAGGRSIVIQAGAAAGDQLTITAGAGTGGVGGALALNGATGSTAGGNVAITGGTGTTTTGGSVLIAPGTGTTGHGSVVVGRAAEGSYSYLLFNSTAGYSQAGGPGLRLNVAGTYMEAWNPTSAAWERITTGAASIPNGTDQYQHLEWTGSAWSPIESVTLPENAGGGRTISVQTSAGAGDQLTVSAGVGTVGAGGALALNAATGSTSGGNVAVTAGTGTTTTGGNVLLAPGAGATAQGSVVLGRAAEGSYSYALFNSTAGFSQAGGPGFRLNVSGTYMEAWNPTSAAWERITTGTGSIPSGTDQYQHLEWTGSAWAPIESVTLPENAGGGRTISIQASAGAGDQLSVTAGAGTAGAGGALAMTAGAGSTAGGTVTISGGAGTTTTGGNVVLNGGDGSTTDGMVILGNATTTEVQFGGTSSVQIDFCGTQSANRINSNMTWLAGADYTLGIEGAAAGVAGDDFTFTSGDGGSSTAGGAGGNTQIDAGLGGDSTAASTAGGNGGATFITGGDGGDASGTTSNGGNGGGVDIMGGDGGTGTTASGNGGDVKLTPGTGSTDGSVVLGNSAFDTAYLLFQTTDGWSQATGPGFRYDDDNNYMEVYNPTTAQWERIASGTGSLVPTVTVTAGEALAASACIAVGYDGSNNPRAYLCDITSAPGAGADGPLPVGFTAALIGSGSSGPLLTTGEVVVPTALWDALPAATDVGKPVYAYGTAGQVSLTPPASGSADYRTKVGVLKSRTASDATVIIQIGDSVLMA